LAGSIPAIPVGLQSLYALVKFEFGHNLDLAHALLICVSRYTVKNMSSRLKYLGQKHP
jgi:hypothetical protein